MIGNLNSIFKQRGKPVSVAPAYDADAQAYFTANTAITSDADKNAINDFYLGLKSDGIYSKIKAMYLPIWGSASDSKWNLINPLDTDAAFRLTFSTGWTFSNSGATPNGTSAYANSFFTSNNTNVGSLHGSYYNRTNSITDYAFGSQASSSTNAFNLSIKNTSTSGSFRVNSNTGNTFSNSTIPAFYILSRTATNALRLTKNNVQIGNVSTATTGNSSVPVFFAAMNNNGTPLSTSYSLLQLTFATFGDGLNTTETTALYNRVNTLMTYFGINV